MPSSQTAALTAEPLARLKIEGRLLHSVAVAALAVAAALFACTSFPVVERTAFGLLAAAAMIAGGDLLSRRWSSQGWWSGTSIMTAGYGLAAFFACASYYVSGVDALGAPYTAWLLELCLAAVAAVHATRNSVLRLLAVPFTLSLTGHALFNALASSDTLSIAGMSIGVSAVASVVGTIWLAGLCALYKQLEQRGGIGTGTKVLYAGAHEGYFLLTALSALALPRFLNSFDYAPLWWAVETPILLAICWRDRSFIKQAMVMGVWATSAALVLWTNRELGAVLSMAVPLSGVALAMTYRFVQSNWAHWQKAAGYCAYLYGAAAVALALPITRLGVQEAQPFFLLEAGVLLALALALRDRILQVVALVTGVGALAVFAADWQQWSALPTILVAVSCYALSLTYGRVKKVGGWSRSEFFRLPGAYVLSAKEAGWLELIAGLSGYAVMLAGTYLLLDRPYNTVGWGVEALALIVFGFITDKMGHRLSGVAALFAACFKLWIFDLSGAGAGVWTAVGFAVFGVCSITAGITYLVEYVWKTNPQRRNDDNRQDGHGAGQ